MEFEFDHFGSTTFQCVHKLQVENPHSISKYPHFLSPLKIFKNPHIFSKKSPFIWHTILKNDPPRLFYCIFMQQFFEENLTIWKKILEMDFFFKIFFKLLKTMKSKLAWIRKWLTRHIYCIFMYQISTNSWIFLLYCQIPT